MPELKPPLHVVILAAGKGKRMRSSLPKVMHAIAGKPMLQHVVETANKLNPAQIHVVYGQQGDLLKKNLKHLKVNWVEQAEQLGTGHAVAQALPQVPEDVMVLVLYGDVPLITEPTLTALLNKTQEQKGLGVIIMKLDNPTGFGRMMRNDKGQVVAIVEEKDADSEQRKIQEVNSGVMAAPAKLWKEFLPKVSNSNKQKEYYLTDVLGLAAKDGYTISDSLANAEEMLGINTKQQLAQVERIYQKHIADNLLQNGVTLLDPARLDVRGTLTTGTDVTIDVNVIFEGDVTIGNNVIIGSNCYLKNTTIKDDMVIKPNSTIEG